jgi:hypothetical protein
MAVDSLHDFIGDPGKPVTPASCAGSQEKSGSCCLSAAVGEDGSGMV